MTDASQTPDTGRIQVYVPCLTTTRLPVRYALALWAGLGLLSWVLIALPFVLG